MRFLFLVLFFCCICALLGAVGYAYLMPGDWIAELAMSALPLIGVVALVGTLYFFSMGHPYPAMLLLLGAAAVMFWITDLGKQPIFTPDKAANDEPRLTVAQWSVAESPALIPWLNKLAPEVDAVVLSGLDADLAKRLPEAKGFKHRLVDVNADTAILSRQPFSQTRQRCWLDDDSLAKLMPAAGRAYAQVLQPTAKRAPVPLPPKPAKSHCLLEADFYLGGHLLRLYTLRPPMPQDEASFRLRNRLLTHVAPILAQSPYPVMLVGDLGLAPYSPYFHLLLEQAKLRAPGKPYLMPGTWPSWALIAPIQATADHALTRDATVLSRGRMARFESDHVPIINRVAF